MEVYPVSLVNIPTTLSMDHMTVLRVVSHLLLLPIDDILSEVHLVEAAFLVA